jgi:hypothetical protein
MDVLSELSERYDPKTAAGILARAAMAAQTGQAYEQSIVENEETLRNALIAEARKKARLNPDDNSPEAIEKISSLLDSESDRISRAPDEASAWTRLIERGDFPSDLYQIRVVQNLIDFFGKDFERERVLIQTTVRAPNKEQHFRAHDEDPAAPSMVSLFAREFRTPYPARNFTMLVVGQRGRGRTLDVHIAWRLYPTYVNVNGAEDLLELLRRFADKYGVDIVLNGEKGRFFLTTFEKVPNKVEIQVPKSSRKRTALITRFFQQRTVHTPDGRVVNQDVSSLVMAIDLDRYRATLKNLDSKQIE